jgi:hypothetical protein
VSKHVDEFAWSHAIPPTSTEPLLIDTLKRECGWTWRNGAWRWECDYVHATNSLEGIRAQLSSACPTYCMVAISGNP